MTLVFAAGLLSPNLGLFVWVTLAFLLLLGLLGKFAWPAILGGLRERESTIEESMTRAERALAEAKQLQQDNESARRDAERQAQTILAEARDEATRRRDADVEKTRGEIADMQSRAVADIDQQKRNALAELRAEVASLAITAAEKILDERIDAGEQSRLVDRFIADLPTN